MWLCLGGMFAQAQSFEPRPLLDSLQRRINLVNDYQADVRIKLDVSFIRIPVRRARVFYKRPDKMRLKAKGFALLPKRGMQFSLGNLLAKPYTAIWVRNEQFQGQPCAVVKVIPLDDNPEVLMATLFINRKAQRLCKAEGNTAAGGAFSIRFGYPDAPNPFDLPGTLEFTFDVNKMALPMGITGDFDSERPSAKQKGPQRATLQLLYSNYLVNKGIPESIFREEASQTH